MEILNFINNEFVPAMGGGFFNKISPFDGSTLSQVANSDAMDVIRALQAAKKAATTWKDVSIEEKAQALEKLAVALEENADQISFLEAQDQGLSQKFVLENSVQVAVKNLTGVAAEMRQELPKDIAIAPNGVVGIITSWSLSLRLVTERLAPALAAGNVVLIKGSEHSPVTTKILGDAIIKAGIPSGVVNIINGNAAVGETVAGHPGIRAVTAVGKSATMQAIAKVGIEQFKKIQLSGSAKNAALVLSEFDYKNNLDKILYPFLMGQGQMCWNISRIFVSETVAADFINEVKTYLANLTPLKNPHGSEVWTPLIDSNFVTSIDEKIKEGTKEHGKVITGGNKGEGSGNYYRPTVMLDLPNCSVLQQDELQGPLLVVTAVKYQHEMIKWANTAYLGHSAVVWGTPEKVLKPASALECSQVWLNQWMSGEAVTIFGHKQSSFGNCEMSYAGSFYSDVKKLTGTL